MEARPAQSGVTIQPKTLVRIIVVILIIALIILLWYWLSLRGRSIVDRGPKQVGALRFLFAIYGPGTQPTPLFNHPSCVATDRAGNIYVTDTENHRVCVFNDNGDFRFEFGQWGVANARPGKQATWEPGRFNWPMGIDVDNTNGDIYVADMQNKRIQVFDRTGGFLRWFPQDLSKTGEFRPYELEVYKDKVYVTSRGRVLIFTRQGKFLKSLFSFGRKPDQVDMPDGLVIGEGDIIFLADKFINRLQAFTPEGKLKWVAGVPPKAPIEQKRTFGLPASVDINSKGQIVIVDAFHFSLQVYSQRGKKLAEVGGRGVGPAQFNFSRGLAITPDDVLYVADMGNNRIQALQITKLVNEKR